MIATSLAILTAAVLPAGAAASPAPTPLSTPSPLTAQATVLSGVACPGDRACVAVGSYETGLEIGGAPAAGLGRQAGLIEAWNGSGWRLSAAPGLSGHPFEALGDVACPAAGTCVAVGQAGPTSDAEAGPADTRPVAMREIDGRWRTSRPVVHGLGATVTELSSVACPQVSACVASGEAQRDGSEVGVIEWLRHGQWRLSATLELTPTENTRLSDISCTQVRLCLISADGETPQGTTPKVVAGVMRLQAGHLSVAGAPGRHPVLGGISCAPQGPCVAVGADTGRRLSAIGMVLSGGVATVLPAPRAAHHPTFDAIACASARRCLAVGAAGAHARPGRAPTGGRPAADWWDGHSFRRAGGAPPLQPDAVACRPAFCIVVGDRHGQAASARLTWTAPRAGRGGPAGGPAVSRRR